ncbi:MAG TPA: ABC transporter permease [Vicinamibacteria bacterium]|nr:ABC transporter permease [Vicinamibacteria bacterium]
MSTASLLRFALTSVSGHRLRSALSTLGIAIGIGSVILLTSIGEGTRRYILGQFTQFGTNLIAINPGKAETLGIPGVLGGTTHKLTLDDMEALGRLPSIEKIVPVVFGMARVEAQERGRSVFVYGVTPDIPDVWKFHVRQGSFWTGDDPQRRQAAAVLGPTLKRELFGNENALGSFVRIGGARFRVVGVMEPKGQFLGFDIDDSAYIPVASAMRIFNVDEVNEIDLIYRGTVRLQTVVDQVTRLLVDRHSGNEDFTITTQEAMLDVMGNVMNVVTVAVGAIAGISLLVGAIGILTMMWIAVGERTHEIGLIRAVGASRRQVQAVFLAEAVALATAGGGIGLLGGIGVSTLLQAAVPGLPVHTPLNFVGLALAVSFLTGVLSGVVPALKASGLDPIEALRAE